MIKNTLNPIQTTEKIGKNIHRRIRTQYNIRRKKPNIQNLELAEEQESKQTLEDPQNIDKLKKFLIDLQSTSLVDNLNAAIIFKEVNSSPDGQQINKQSPQTPIIKEEAKTEQIKNDLANDRNKKKAIYAAIYVASNYERLPLISYIEMEKNLIKTLSENEAQMMRVLKENQNVKALDFIADNKHIPAKIRKKAHEIVTEIRKQLGLEKKIKKTKIIRYGQSLRYINRTHHARA